MSSLIGDSSILKRAIEDVNIASIQTPPKFPTRISDQLYFNLYIVEESKFYKGDWITSYTYDEPEELEPAKAYKILVTTDVNEVPGQNPIRIQENSALILKLESNYDVSSKVIVSNPKADIPTDAIDNFHHEFEITLSDTLPRIELEIKLLYARPFSRPIIASTKKIKLAGTYNPIDQGFLDRCQVFLDLSRPVNSAIMHINNIADDKFEIIGWGYYGDHVLHTPPFAPPQITLSNFIENEVRPQAIRGAIRGFSNSNIHLGLISWLKKLYKKYSDNLNLIIVDHSNSEIPWEMLELDVNVYLGTLFPIVRWLPVPIPFEERWRYLDTSEKQLTGEIIAYLDNETDPDALEERRILDQFNTRFHHDFDHLTKDIKVSLNKHNIGLVYLGCHGIFSYSESHKISVSSYHNPKKIMSVLDFELLPYLDSYRPFVFINACHSARVMRDGDNLCGLSIVLLKLIANEFIGTLGPVSSKFAVKFADFILSQVAYSSEGLSLAEVLRKLRINAVEKIINDENSEENQLYFIYTFMFVYFGNPLARLKLLIANEKGDQDKHA